MLLRGRKQILKLHLQANVFSQDKLVRLLHLLHLENEARSGLLFGLLLLELTLQLDVQVLLLYVLLVQGLHLLGQRFHLLCIGVLRLGEVLDAKLQKLCDLV